MKFKIFVDELEKNRTTVIANWIKNQEVLSLLNKYGISNEYFVKEYAIHILNYYIEVAKGKKKIGDCPAIDNLLTFLKYNNLQTNELFLLCSGFKNALIQLIYELNLQSYELDYNINFLFEQNFSGILQKYFKKEDEVKFDRLLALSDKYIIMSSTDTKGIITSVSQAFCDISGYTKEELIGQPHNIVRHPDTPSVFFEDMWETIQSGMTWRGEFKNLKKDGSYYWVSAMVEPHYDNKHNIVGYDAIRQDISLVKELEDQQHILVEQSKSAAMGEMISMIAHQWRQPLQAVSILVQKLPLTKMIDGEITDEILEKVVDDVGKQLEYMSKTIDDFRDFFKPEKAKQKILMYDLIKKSKDFLEYMLKVDSIEFEINSIEDATLSLHVNEVVQVLINIIKNARDAMIEKEIKNRKIVVRHFCDKKHAIIEIEDNAGGIKPEVIKKIFEPYFSTKKNKNGTGLGLYMSKKIIEQYCAGAISVKNFNDGVIFKIELPLN